MTSDNSKYLKFKKILGYSLPLFLMIIFLYMAFKNIDLKEVMNLIGNISILWYMALLSAWFFSHLVRAVRWKIIVKSVKKDTSLLNLFGAIMVGYGVNCVVPRLGELYRGLFLGRWEDISRSSMIGTIVLERIIDILVLGISVLVSVAIYTGNLYSEIEWLRSTIYVGFTVILALIIFLVLVVKLKEKFYKAILNFIGRFSSKLADSLARIFHFLTEGFASIKGTKDYMNVIFLSIIIMLLYGLTSYIAFYVLHMDQQNNVDFAMAWIVMTISAFGVIIPTPGATGSYHLIVIFVLVNIFNFDKEISGAYALLTHATTYILFVLSTIVLSYFINKRQSSKGMPSANFLTAFKTKTGLI